MSPSWRQRSDAHSHRSATMLFLTALWDRWCVVLLSPSCTGTIRTCHFHTINVQPHRATQCFHRRAVRTGHDNHLLTAHHLWTARLVRSTDKLGGASDMVQVKCSLFHGTFLCRFQFFDDSLYVFLILFMFVNDQLAFGYLLFIIATVWAKRYAFCFNVFQLVAPFIQPLGKFLYIFSAIFLWFLSLNLETTIYFLQVFLQTGYPVLRISEIFLSLS